MAGFKKKVLIIYTGGTIGMMKDEEGTYHPFDFDLLQSHIPELNSLSAEVTGVSFKNPMDSSNMGPKVWIKLASIIQEHYYQYDGFVILHGSDTMAYTGSALSFIVEGLSKPIILTGAQLPIGEIRNDARENLIAAIEIAAHPDSPIREVCIYFEYKLYRANRSKKIHADVFHAFSSPNFRHLAEAGIQIRFFHPTPEDAYTHGRIPFRVQDKLETRIGHIKFYPGLDQIFFDSVLNHPETRGIIIESYGSGNLPTDPDLIDSIKRSIAAGKVILNITQCNAGTVEMGRYETSKLLAEAGVLSGLDLTFEAALTKVMYLLGKYKDPEQVKFFLVRNIRGELTGTRGYSV